jgi:ribosomal protein S12 methylthiotransferase accessory factor
MRYETLCATFGGVLSTPRPVVLSNFSDRVFHCYGCHAGNLSALLPSARSHSGGALWHTYLSGCGADLDPGLARLKAVCEAAERYSACILLDHEYIVASANELGPAALDWRRLPRFSAEELAAPNQQFREFDPDDPIRWVQAVNLNTGGRQYVPAAMSHLYPRTWSGEQFWSPISTGTAVHHDPATALVTAIAEVVERDSIALTWLLRRRLRRIRFDGAALALFPAAVRPLLEHRQEYLLFDGTTDFGLPTVYLRRHRPSHPHAANLVTCASSFSFADACCKTLREVATLSSILDTGHIQPVAHAGDCFSIEDGAVYMARPERAHAFEFLDGRDEVPFADLRAAQPLPDTSVSGAQLGWLKQRAKLLGHEVLLLELTCDELRQVGLRSFRALIPSLMPMSTITSARYLGAPRLAQFRRYLQRRGELPAAPAINPFPQAFA